MLGILKWLLILLLILLLTVFAVVNRHFISVSLFPLPYEIELPAYLFMAIFFLLGFSLCALYATFRRIGIRRALHRSEKRSHLLEEETIRLKYGSQSPS